MLTCADCRFWNLPPWDGPTLADCRRHAPAVLVYSEDDGMGENRHWPRTRPDDWCGDAEPLDEAAIERRRQERDEWDNSPAAKYLSPPPPPPPAAD